MNHSMRKRYNNNGGGGRRGGGGHNSGGYRGQNRNSNNGGAPRPRKNFRALQEKFLNQAKDAMASGDRILAEYYLQHADHYFRMNEEFLAERAEHQEKRNAKREQREEKEEAAAADAANEADDAETEDAAEGPTDVDTGSTALPSFITSSGGGDAKGVKVVNLQDWDE